LESASLVPFVPHPGSWLFYAETDDRVMQRRERGRGQGGEERSEKATACECSVA